MDPTGLFGGGGTSITSGPAVSEARSTFNQGITFGSAFNVNSGANTFERIVQMALPFAVAGVALWLVLRKR